MDGFRCPAVLSQWNISSTVQRVIRVPFNLSETLLNMRYEMHKRTTLFDVSGKSCCEVEHAALCIFLFVNVLLCWMTHSLMCDPLVLQLPEAFQGDENKGPAVVVQADPQRPSLPAHQSPAHHSQGPEMWQHLYHRANGLGEDWRPWFSHAKEGVLCQECHR